MQKQESGARSDNANKIAHESLVLIAFSSNKGTREPAQMQKLAGAFDAQDVGAVTIITVSDHDIWYQGEEIYE